MSVFFTGSLVESTDVLDVLALRFLFSFVVFDANRRTEEDPPYWLELTRGVAGGHDTSKLPLIIFER